MDTKSQPAGHKNTMESQERTLFDTIGDELRRARIAKNQTVKQVSEALNIKSLYIDALENNETDVFPAAVYGIAFLRSYAAYLELDSDLLVQQYKEKNASLSNAQADFPIHTEAAVIPDKTVLIGAGVILLLLVAGVSFVVHFNKTVSQNEPVAPEVTLVETSPVETDVPVEKPLPETTLNTPNTLPAETRLIQTEQKNGPQALADAYPEIKGERFGLPDKSRVVLVAEEAVWISITKQNEIIFNRVLNQGDAYFVPADEQNLMLRTGNAPSLSVYVDKMPKGPLSRHKKIMSNVKLNAETFLNKK